MPYFSNSAEDLAFEKMMQHKPNFEPDSPETTYIQHILDRDKQQKEKRRKAALDTPS